MYAFCILSSIGYGDDTGGGGVAVEAAAGGNFSTGLGCWLLLFNLHKR